MRLVIPGTPVPKARPRTVIQGGRAHTYTPRKTRQWEETVRAVAMLHRPPAPYEGPLAVTMVFYLPKPKSSKRRWPSVKPDLDNLIKACSDALNGVIWRDDSQIVKQTCEKRYGDHGDSRVEIEIEELEG